jgi:hypothetical protein
VVDLKTARDLQYGWLEIAVQLAVYARAKVRFDKSAKVWEPMPENMDLNVALVVHLPATAPGDSVKAEMHAVDIAFGHEMARLCTEVREGRKHKGVATLLAVVEEEGMAGPELTESFPMKEPWRSMREDGEQIAALPAHPGVDVVRQPTLLERVETARTEDDLTAIWWDAVRTRQDGKPLGDAITKRKQALLADSAAG